MTADNLPDDGLLQAYIDDELASEDRELVEKRIAADPVWAAAFQELNRAASLLTRGLAAQDALSPPTEAPPWIGVLKRGARATPRRFPFGRAAAVAVLVAGTVASGLPGSPVREWFADQFARPAATPPEPVILPLEEPDVPRPEDVGVRVPTPAGSLEVVLPELAEGVSLLVRLDTDGEVGVFGPTGTSFRTRDGQVEVLNPTGMVRVDLPAELNTATILVGGAVYLQKDRESLEVTGPVSERSDSVIRFGPHAKVP